MLYQARGIWSSSRMNFVRRELESATVTPPCTPRPTHEGGTAYARSRCVRKQASAERRHARDEDRRGSQQQVHDPQSQHRADALADGIVDSGLLPG